MNKDIEKHLYLDSDTEKEMWNNCIVVFDTSALLSLYDYTEVFREKFFAEVLEKFKSRLFITGHTEFEFFKNRRNKIENPINQKIKPFKEYFLKELNSPILDIQKTIKRIKGDTKKDDRVPYFTPDIFEGLDAVFTEFKKVIEEFGKEANKRLKDQTDEILKLKDDDLIYNRLLTYFEVAIQYSFNEITQLILSEGEFRHKNLIPPGYMDNPSINKKSSKSGIQVYGDLIIWKQVIELAAHKKSNILFVTNDLKPDWCEKDKDNPTRIKHPNPDLVKEFMDLTGHNFWMYSVSDILYFSNKYLDTNFSDEEINIVDQIALEDDLQIKIYSSKKCSIRCLHCGNINDYRPDDLSIEFEAVGGSERGMGPETHYQSKSYLSCLACDNSIELELNIWEYPAGVHNYQQEEIDRGEILTMYDYVTDFWSEQEEGKM